MKDLTIVIQMAIIDIRIMETKDEIKQRTNDGSFGNEIRLKVLKSRLELLVTEYSNLKNINEIQT